MVEKEASIVDEVKDAPEEITANKWLKLIFDKCNILIFH